MRLITYLAPGIPMAFFDAVARGLATELGEEIDVVSDPRFSGPPPHEPNPLTTGVADLAFVCGPSYVRMADEVTLVPAAPVFDDPRAPGRPVYFVEVCVGATSPATRLDDLAGARFAFNDPESLSGWYALAGRLGRDPREFFGAVVASGSHRASLDLLARGEVDVCTVDANALRWMPPHGRHATGRPRIVESLGPYPVQPVVASRALKPDVVARIADALLGIPRDVLPPGVSGFAPIASAAYAELARLLPDRPANAPTL